MLKKYIGDKEFYKTAFFVALPMMLQNAITNFVSLVDNIMVGRVGTLEMTGVSVVNQLLFVFNLCVFGAVSGAGIFTAQFFGNRDHRGIRHTMRFKIIICLAVASLGLILFGFWGRELIALYLSGDGTKSDRAAALGFGVDYLKIMMIGLIPFAINNAYASTMRETGQTLVPMVSGFVGVGVNMSLNYVLIFGELGFPKLGVVGAAIATVISRYAELTVNIAWLHRHNARFPYVKHLYRSLYISQPLLKNIMLRGMPLFVNELLWAGGMAFLSQCYSLRGLEVVAANNIVNTLWNLFSVCLISLGGATGIIIGQMLGAGKGHEEIKDCDRKLIAFSVASCAIFGVEMAAVSGIFPAIYNTSSSVKELATAMICIMAALMPFSAYANAAYFTLRSGGKTLITFLFDSCFVWVVCVPTAFILSRYTAMPIIPLFIICNGLEIIKCFLGGYMLKKGSWIQNIVVE